MPYNFYDAIIKYIIKNYKLKNKNVYISFDHMYCLVALTVFVLNSMFLLKLIIISSDMIASISDIEPLFSKSLYFDSVRITSFKFQTKLAVSKTDSHKEPFFILTNGNTREAIKHYGYRFGSIEFIFKNQKSNGFYLESTKMRNIQSFTTLFTLVCIAILWLTILGSDYTKNKSHFKNCFKIRYSRKNGSGNKRTFSLFNTGLFFFNLAFESTKYIVLKCNFLLYDI